MRLLDLNPAVAWEETLDGLKQGLIDDAETWASAVASLNMSPVVSQSVDLKFFCGTEHTAMNAKVFDSLEGCCETPSWGLYLAQVHVQAANEATLVCWLVFKSSASWHNFVENDVVWRCYESESKWPKMCSPEFQPAEWEQWRTA